MTRRVGKDHGPVFARHSFVSIMSDSGVPIETIADLVGHVSTAVTEEVDRHQLKPVITRGAENVSTIFDQQKHAKPASASGPVLAPSALPQDRFGASSTWSEWPDLNRRPLRPELSTRANNAAA
jgi:hypothetical protein